MVRYLGGARYLCYSYSDRLRDQGYYCIPELGVQLGHMERPVATSGPQPNKDLQHHPLSSCRSIRWIRSRNQTRDRIATVCVLTIDYNLNNLNVLEPLFGGEGGEFSFSVGDSIMITELIGVEVLRIHICFRHSFGYRASASSPLLFPPSAQGQPGIGFPVRDDKRFITAH